MASKFTRGENFQDGQANGVTAAKLHALIEGAAPTTALITELSEKTSPASGDMIFMYDAAAGALKKLDYANTSLSPSVFVGYRNLLIKNNSGTPASIIDISADDVVLKNGSGTPKYHSSVSVTANITTSGAGGLDTSSAVGSTYYYVWLISDGTTVSALLSTSSTSPVMPGVYTYKALFGGVYYTATNDFWTFQQRDDEYFTVRQANSIASAFVANSDPTSATNYVTFLMDGSSSKPFIPPNAIKVFGNLGHTDADSSRLIISGSTAGVGAQTIEIADSGVTADSFTSSGAFIVPIITAQTVFIKEASAASSGHIRISISGFKIKR